ncbi:MAG: extracellular solute-binding protein [Anaerolineaceae bacterium]|nr:extracellular solute-binding protein [Anaerolineaceae bacterium]
MSKKMQLFFSVLICLVFCLGACSTPPAATNPAPSKTEAASPAVPSPAEPTAAQPSQVPTAEPKTVTISFWHSYNETSPENEMLVKTLIPLFEKENPGIKIDALSVPYESFHQKLITSIGGGVAPDLIRADIIWVPELAEMGALASLEDKMPEFNKLKEAIFPGPMSTTLWNNHYYGLPLDTNTKVWISNPDMYAAAKIEKPAEKISELMSQCEQIKAVNPDHYLFATDGTFAWTVLPWIWSMGGDILSPDLTTATGFINGPKSVAAYELWLELFEKGCMAPVVLGNGVDVWTGFAQDQYASLDNGPWTYPIIKGQFPDKKIAASPFPAGEAGSIDVVGGEDVVLFEQSKNKEAALKFIQFLLSPTYQFKMAEVGQIPVLTEAIHSDFIKNHAYYPVFMKQLETAKARPALPEWNKIDEIITEAGQLILRKEKTPQAALDEAAAKIDKLLK